MKKLAVGLVVSGFIVGIVSLFLPPMGTIDPSVLTFLGWVAVVVGILFAWESVDRGMDAKVTHGQTSIELNNPDNE